MPQYHYTAEDIRDLIAEDLKRRLGEEVTVDNLPFFSDSLNGYYVSVPEIIEENEVVDSDVLQIISVGEPPTTGLSSTTTEVSNLPLQSEAPISESDNPDEIEELLEWATEHQRMVQIVYMKRIGSGFERSARIITPLEVNYDRVRTILHVTMRDSVEPEYTIAEDNRRTFIIALIEKAKIVTEV